MSKLQVLDLFSGIGGFSLGLEATGHFETAAFCEYEEWPRRVLNKHWPEVPIYPDVRELTNEQLKQDGINGIDIITGGFPCQPFSLAGLQRAQEDDRHLWPEMFRIIRETQPTWVIGENVAGLINLGLDEVCADLEGEGYAVQPFIIPACAVGASHRRDRVWIMAHRHEQGPQGAAYRWPIQRGQVTGGHPGQGGGPAERDGGQPEPNMGGLADGLPAGLAGFGWLPEPRIGRVATGVPDRVNKIKALGNAVVPQVVQVIGEAIAMGEN